MENALLRLLSTARQSAADSAIGQLFARQQPKLFILSFSFVCCLALAGCGGLVVAPNAGASLSINAQKVSFGYVTVNTPSTQSIVLVSSGSAPVTITGSKVTGTGFSISGLVTPMTLSPGQSVTVSVQFLPAAAGSVTGQLTLTTNSTTTPVLQIVLTGGSGSAAAYQVNLSWNPPGASSTPIAGYQVYRAASGNSQFQLLSGSVVAPTSFTDPDVQSGTTYDYYVTTVDVQGAQSAPSNVAEVTVP